MAEDVSKAVLITGCSSGLGRQTALALHRQGHTVYATARRPEAIADLAAQGLRTLALDVTDEESMAAAVRHVEQEHGPIGLLVNNAAYGLHQPVELAEPAEVRAQFDTNVFGLVRMTLFDRSVRQRDTSIGGVSFVAEFRADLQCL